MLCHPGAWGMASESGQHGNMAFSKLSKSHRFMHTTVVLGVQVDKSQKTECPHQNNMRAVATFWLAAVNLNFAE